MYLLDSLTDSVWRLVFFLDRSPEVEQMVSQEFPVDFELHIDPSSESLNPLTLVVTDSTDDKASIHHVLLRTDYLMTDEGQEFLRKTFAGE